MGSDITKDSEPQTLNTSDPKTVSLEQAPCANITQQPPWTQRTELPSNGMCGFTGCKALRVAIQVVNNVVCISLCAGFRAIASLMNT